jgi:hypothetical protein
MGGGSAGREVRRGESVEGRAGVKRTLAARSAHAKRDGAAGLTNILNDGSDRAADRTSTLHESDLMPRYAAWNANAPDARPAKL